MSAPDVLIRLARTDDFNNICQLLNDCQLPNSDLSPEHLESFYVAVQDDKVIGGGGFERAGGEALLRSVAVQPDQQGTGLGRRLVLACQELANSWGLRAIYLIPNDAEAQAFFLHLGCTEVARTAAPVALLPLSEFTYLCPQTHPCLRMVQRPIDSKDTS